MNYAPGLSAATVLLLVACSGRHDRVEPSTPAPAAAWHHAATPDDRRRLRGWRDAWVEGLAKARASGFAAQLAQQGKLLDPDAAETWRTPPDGTYRCRTIKIGAQRAGMLDYVAYPAFDCRISSDRGTISLARLQGSQRPIGRLLPDSATRMIFLGTLQLGDETRTFEYGGDEDRDLAAVVERIGENRWRLAFPYPHFESTIDVMELVPKTVD